MISYERNQPNVFNGYRKVRNSRVANAPRPEKSTFFKISWWNGGGNIKLRLCINPELRKFLALKPDIFVYGETCTPSSIGLTINGYASLHT